MAKILVIDDGSPDGTGSIVEKLKASNSRIHLLNRTKKEELAAAYLAGFAWGLERDFGWIFEMDADFSHNPKYLAGFFNAISSKQWDGVLGS
jgi:dolichol-phosphate mannosyltransferase